MSYARRGRFSFAFLTALLAAAIPAKIEINVLAAGAFPGSCIAVDCTPVCFWSKACWQRMFRI